MLELDLFSTARGTVTAPAGCGKTQLIADTLKAYTDRKPVLILTHTNAGKGALEARLTRATVPRAAYRVSTIDSWCIRLISKFPLRSAHSPGILALETPATDYKAVRDAAWRLLCQGDIGDALKSSYSRLLVDEYQDCSIPQHNIIGWAASVIPTCVLGDPLQAIFGFAEPTVDWKSDVLTLFPALGELGTPWRWRNAGAEALGQWLLNARVTLLAGAPLDLRNAPAEVSWIQLSADQAEAHRQRMAAALTKSDVAHGTVLVIGDSKNPRNQREVASHTPGATTVEAVDLRDLTAFGKSFDPNRAGALAELINFATEMMNNLGAADLLKRMDSLTKGTAKRAATPSEAAALAFAAAPSHASALHTLKTFEDAPDVRVYRPEVLRVCKTALHTAATGACSFYQAVVQARERNRHLGRPIAKRAVGSTLLLKGLEADVAVVLNPIAMDARHLYVALTRGARKLVVCSPTPVLSPAK